MTNFPIAGVLNRVATTSSVLRGFADNVITATPTHLGVGASAKALGTELGYTGRNLEESLRAAIGHADTPQALRNAFEGNLAVLGQVRGHTEILTQQGKLNPVHLAHELRSQANNVIRALREA